MRGENECERVVEKKKKRERGGEECDRLGKGGVPDRVEGLHDGARLVLLAVQKEQRIRVAEPVRVHCREPVCPPHCGCPHTNNNRVMRKEAVNRKRGGSCEDDKPVTFAVAVIPSQRHTKEEEKKGSSRKRWNKRHHQEKKERKREHGE